MKHNLGYGPPLWPEFLLTTLGMQSGPTCAALDDVLRERGLERGLKKWSMPVLRAPGSVRGGVRFSALRAGLENSTDRALTLALKNLQGAGLVTRLVLDFSTLYQATGRPSP